MTNDTRTPTTTTQEIQIEDVRAAVQTLLPTIRERADEIELARRLPPDLVAVLTEAGCYRTLVPRSHGGVGADLPDQLRIVADLASADGSVGWTVMLGSMAPLLFGFLPRHTFDMLYADFPDLAAAGVFNPTGMATPVDGGYRVTGRWTFASGCQHCDWFLGHCVVPDGREPPVRMMLLHPMQISVEDTWHVSGLCGTGSHDVVVDDVFVPDDHTFVLGGEPSVAGPLWRVPELSDTTLQIATVAVGIAEGAMADISDMAGTKTPAFQGDPLGANPYFRNRLAAADARLRAARHLLLAEAEAAWAQAIAGDAFTAKDRGRIRASTTWVTEAAAAVVDWAYQAGGGSSIRSDGSLQRRFRDVHAVTQHFTMKPDTYTTAGAIQLGHEVDMTFV